MMEKRFISRILRFSLAFVFLYAGISSLLSPYDWIGFIPSFMQNRMDPFLLLTFHAVFEIILGIWLITGVYVKYAAIISFVSIFAIILFNYSQFIIVFRDIPMLGMAYILVRFHKK